MHGRLKPAERRELMARFKARELDVLVATTVIEVGVDVPNATIMIVQEADRFGLAQLHQLRGRVGRGAEQSYCLLISGPKEELTESAHDRLEALVASTDGFELAEKDLEIRGGGALLGARQSGLSDLRFARITHDRELLEEARDTRARCRPRRWWRRSRHCSATPSTSASPRHLARAASAALGAAIARVGPPSARCARTVEQPRSCLGIRSASPRWREAVCSPLIQSLGLPESASSTARIGVRLSRVRSDEAPDTAVRRRGGSVRSRSGRPACSRRRVRGDGGTHVTTVTRVGIRELRDTLTQVIRRVRNGETIEITHDGEPVARIVPQPEDPIAQLIAAGKLHRARVARTYPLPPPVKQTGPISASEALADDRGD